MSEPETSFEFIRGWFVKAADNAKKQGKKESALLWTDGLAHLDHQQAEITKLREALTNIAHGKVNLPKAYAQSVLNEFYNNQNQPGDSHEE